MSGGAICGLVMFVLFSVALYIVARYERDPRMVDREHRARRAERRS